MFKQSLRLVNTAIVVALLAGCQGYSDPSKRTIGEFTDDAALQARVKTAMIRDPEVKGWYLNTEVRRGVVTIYGRVPSEYAREKAMGVAGGVRGVLAVEDRLTLIP